METSSSCPYAISKMTKQMSSSNTPPTRLETVRLYLSNLNDFSAANLPGFLTVKAYGELPENAKINETDTFGEEVDECHFEFADGDGDVDIDDI